uniref:Major sperm protein n=1 Tax=Caenorhabditis tropicalis TaxID=1561998 RepID=A0A1I7TGG0_9PELO
MELNSEDLHAVERKKEEASEFPLKITPEKLFIPSSGHLDIQIVNPRTEEGFSVNVTLSSLSLEITRFWYMNKGKEEEGKEKQHNEFCHKFENDKKTVYFRIGHAKTLNPLLKVSLETPEGSVEIKCSRWFEAIEETESERGRPGIELMTFRRLELSAESKSLEVKEKFLEYQKNQNRRNRLIKMVFEDEEKEIENMLVGYEYPLEEYVKKAKRELKERRDRLNEKLFLENWQKIDELSDDQIKKLFEEEKRKEAIERLEKEEEMEKKRKLEMKKDPIVKKKKKKKCVVM